MPSSAWENHDFARERFDRAAPKRVLDVGPGSGKWAKVLGDRPRRPHAGEHWTGLEVFPRYVLDYDLTSLYDRIVVDDVRRAGDVIGSGFDLIILGDILEHLEPAEARDVAALLRGSGAALLVAGPIVRFEQGSWGGNDHEAHLWHPTVDDWLELVEPDAYALGDIVGTFWRDAR